jgi:hypothetical protein
MTPSQLKRRETLLVRSDTALDRWPERTGHAFIREMTAVASGLEALAEEADAAGGDRLERCRTWRFAGNAYFDLGNGKELPEMRRAADALRKADTLLKGIDNPIERLKLNYSFGHALFHLCDAKDIELAREARDRYASALTLAREHMPAGISTAEQALANAERVISLLQTVSHLDERIGEIKETLKSHPPSPTQHEWPQELQSLFGQLQREYRQEVDMGKVSEVRQQALGPVLDQLEQMLQHRPDDLAGKTSQTTHLRELMARVAPLLGRTSQGQALPPGTRAEAVWQRFSGMKTALAQDLMRPHMGSEERLFGMDLYKRCGHADTFLHQQGHDDATVWEYERDVLRQLTADMRAYSLRNHLTLTRPVWPTPPLPQDPSSVFYAGTDSVQRLIAEACKRASLTLLVARTAKDFAGARWDQLRTSHVAVFDYTSYRVPDCRRAVDLAVAGPMAAVSYELGIALTLGRAVVVIANAGQELPFDVDIDPVRLHGNEHDCARIADALDDALYRQQRGGSGSSLSPSQEYLSEHFARHPDFVVAQSMQLIDQSAERDPVRFRRFVEPLLGAAGAAGPHMIFPAWPGSYPQLLHRRLFHVTAFGPAWASDTMKIASYACASTVPSVEYIRGDHVLDADIIRSIWDNLCQATHVLVDLTGLNANVALELGIAHTLGRNVLLVSQDGPAQGWFSALAKLRVHRYSLDGPHGSHALRDALDGFLAGAGR